MKLDKIVQAITVNNGKNTTEHVYNSKLATYNAGQRLFNGVEQLDTEIPSSNGVLHALKGVSPFAFNIYDYIGEHQNEFQTIYNALTDPAINKRIFSESSSTPGGMNSEGQMVYIDSVYSYSNELLDQSGAQIKIAFTLLSFPKNLHTNKLKRKLKSCLTIQTAISTITLVVVR